MKKILFVLILIPAFASFNFAQTVIHSGKEGQSLQQRFDGAIKEIQQSKFPKGAWIGYSIARLMSENEFIGSFDDSRKHSTSLRELITGQKVMESPQQILDSEKHVREEAKRALEGMEQSDKTEKKVWKEIAVLSKFSAPRALLMEVDVTEWTLAFRLENIPLIWLGKSNEEQSISLLQKLYRQGSEEEKEDILSAIGIHTKSDLVLPALNAVIDSNESEDLRKSAVFWLGQTGHPAALNRLLQIVKSDRSEEVRTSAVFSISEMRLPGAEQILIDLAKGSRDREVRMEAIFWIGQKEYPNAGEFLEKIVFEGADLETQKKAIFSLSQMHGDETMNRLIKIAKTHKALEARKEAIFWLAERSSKKAVQELSDFAYRSEETEIQKQAVFALSQFSGDDGVKELIEIARHHKNPAIRKEAIFWLGQTEHPEAVKAILEVLEKSQ
ncbi:MAG TPA: HEAT repeat domain-containing protein [Acidobacteriota bacterium]